MRTVFVLILLFVLLAAGVAAWMWHGITTPYQGFSPEGVFVTVPHGSSRRTVARLLEQNGVVRNAIAFEIYARRHPKRTMQAGEYFFDHAMSGQDVFWKIAKGEVYEQPFTVREGQTIFDVARNLEASKFLPADDFLKAANDPSAIRDLAPQAETLEGFLFPATYHLPRHPVAQELALEMVKKFKAEWAQIRSANQNTSDAGEPQPDIVSVVTLASLVERETPRPEERPLVASVFTNRLRKGMRMQCDPTVIYGLERLGQYNGTLTGRDLAFDTPYNTYMHAGLPPGPIGNPGGASLKAAWNPAQTKNLYFVANTQGGHFFSATLAEHNRNVVKYRRLLAGLPADPPAVAPLHPRKHGKRRKGAAR